MEESETLYFNASMSPNNSELYGEKPTLPPGMTFSNQSLTVIIIYCMCFLIAAVGNLTVFITLSRGRYRKSRISLMICHLSVADLLVTFIMIPIEVGWRITVEWIAGNSACKIFSFLRAFGLYLSSNILVCISLDRYFAVVHPLRVTDARRRGKMMLIIAWLCSIIYAIPQCFIFHVSTHPDYPNFQQCVTFESGVHEGAYTAFCVLAMYFAPLGVICWAYTKILCEISSKSRDSRQAIPQSNSNGTFESNGTSVAGSRLRLRRSDMSSIERARSRTLRMTITIVAVFILCWTPYVAMLMWYTVDRQSAETVDPRLQDALFIMAVGNSCANPLVYGSYAIDFRKECCRCFLPYTSSRRIEGLELTQRNNGKSYKTPKTKSPGVSSIIVRHIRHAVPRLLRAGSRATQSTATSGNTMIASSSPNRIISDSISTSKSIHEQKHERMTNFLEVPDDDVIRVSSTSAILVLAQNT